MADADKRSGKKLLGVFDVRGYLVAVGFAALLAGTMLLYFGPWRADENTEGRRPRGSGRTQAVAAEQQRRAAADACRNRNWDECEIVLDLAAVLDPAGERSADVQTLREAIAAGRREPPR
jgi:hypothetical protein